MPKKQAPKGTTTNVIVDCRDASKDRVVPTLVAKQLCDAGKLVRDLTNHCYATPETGRCIHELLDYPRRG